MISLKVRIPSGIYGQTKQKFRTHEIKSPEGKPLHLSIPKDEIEISTAGIISLDYNERIESTNIGTYSRNQGYLNEIVKYNLNKPWRLIFTAVYSHKAEAMIATEVVLDNEHNDYGQIFVYQKGVNKEFSTDNDLSVLTQLYNRSLEAVLTALKHENIKCSGIFTESINSGPEFSAIKNAGFDILVPTEYYKPPNHDNLVLMARDMLVINDLESELESAEKYLEFAYGIKEESDPARKLVEKYFVEKYLQNNIKAVENSNR